MNAFKYYEEKFKRDVIFKEANWIEGAPTYRVVSQGPF